MENERYVSHDAKHDDKGRYCFPEEVFHVVSYTHSPSPTLLAYEEAFRSSRPKQWPGGGDGRGAYCEGGHNCSAPPSYSVDGRKPAVLCGTHRENGMHRVWHDDRNCGYKGCGRLAQVRYMSEDGKINRFCPKHKNPDVIVTRTRHCQYARCYSTPGYGMKGGPQSFCREHKRAGMFTSRNGELLVATRDGSAFRTEASTVPSVVRKGANEASGSADSTPHSPARSAPGGGPAAKSAEVASSPLQDSKTSPYSPGKNMLLSRKLCEVPGCRVQPSYGETGTSRPRFCSGHKKKGMVGLKNRPCLFPGCDIRPHYGLSGGRPQYCASHKSDDMIHLLKESMSRERVHTPRKLDGHGPVATDTKDRPAVAGSKEKKHKALGVRETAGREGDNGDEQNKEQQETKGRAKGKNSKRVVVVAGKGNSGRKGKVSASQPPSASPPPVLQAAPCSNASAKGSEIAPTAQTLAGGMKSPPTTSRMAEAPGMAPSVEIRLFREARESAKAAAAATGSGRRARAPSRKALEASGKMSSEGAQWMTREKREEQERQKRDMKEKRRAAAAAGLKAGHVIESFAVAAAGGAGSRSGGGVGSRSLGVGNRGKLVVSSSCTTGELVPAETLQAAARQPSEEGFTPTTDDSNAIAEGRAEVAGSNGRAGGVTPVAVVEASKEPAKKRELAESEADRGVESGKKKKRRGKGKVGSYGGGEVHTERTPNKEVKKRSGRKGKEGMGGGSVVRGAARSTVLCDFQSCPKAALYGVNDTVRYCKEHRLFGMHRIEDKA